MGPQPQTAELSGDQALPSSQIVVRAFCIARPWRRGLLCNAVVVQAAAQAGDAFHQPGVLIGRAQ